jgi:hypothetical protein
MALDAFTVSDSEPEIVNYSVRILGTGAAAPTKLQGKGITVGRSGVGVYTLTFDNRPGAYQGMTFGFDADTPLNVAGCTAAITTSTTTTNAWTFTVYSGGTTPAARELAATERLTLNIKFKRVTV